MAPGRIILIVDWGADAPGAVMPIAGAGVTNPVLKAANTDDDAPPSTQRCFQGCPHLEKARYNRRKFLP